MHACAAAQVEGSGIAEPQRIVALFRSAAAIAGLSRFDEHVKLDTLVRRRRHRIAPHRTAPHRIAATVSGSGDGIVVTVNAARQNSALLVALYARLHVALLHASNLHFHVPFQRRRPRNAARSHVVLGTRRRATRRSGDGRRRRKVSDRFSLSRHDCREAATAGGTVESPATHAASDVTAYRT
jgi:hypothetical protein